MRNFFKKILFSVPFVTVFGITLLDLVWMIIGRTPEMVRLLRDGVLLAALIMLLPLQARLALFRERRVFLVLRNLLLAGLASYFLFTLLDRYVLSGGEAVPSASRLFLNTRQFVFGTLFALFITLLHLIMLGLMRVLVFYKSRSSTLRNFRLLLFALLFFAAVSSAQGGGSFFSRTPFEAGPLGIVSFSAVILLVVLNSFRTAWIQFLNRGQKWAVFVLAVLACVLGSSLTVNVRTSFVADYSIAYAAFISGVSLFFAVYAGISAFLLFLSLPTAGLFDEKISAIKSLQELTQSISRFMDRESLMDMITQRALQVTKSDFAWLELVEDESGNLVLGSAVNLTEEEKRTIPMLRASGISGYVLLNRKSLLANDVNEDSRTSPLTAWKKDIGAVLAVPLLTREHIFGILYSAKRDFFSYDQFDQDMLQSYADQAAIALENTRLLRASLEKERLAQELLVAHEAQAKLLPKTMPHLPGIEVAGLSIAAYEVGGDYYDVFQRGDQLAVVVGDVSGKGAAAAFYMAQVKGVMEALGRIYESPREILIQANEILSRSLEKNLFVSLIYALFDPANMHMTLSRAGHNPLLWCPHDAEPCFLQPRGLGLGLDRGSLFASTLEQITLPLRPGDFFVFYTDGLVEARDARNQEFEERALLEVVRQNKPTTAQALKDNIMQSLRAHVGTGRAHDDFTLVVVGIAAPAQPGAGEAAVTAPDLMAEALT